MRKKNLIKPIIISAIICSLLFVLGVLKTYEYKQKNIQSNEIVKEENVESQSEIQTDIEENIEQAEPEKIKTEVILPVKKPVKVETKKKVDNNTNQIKDKKAEQEESVKQSTAENEPKQAVDKPQIKRLLSYKITKFTDAPELKEALELLEETDEEVVKNIQKYGIRIKFDDFVNIVYKRDSYFAMSAYNQYGTRYILINSMYKTAPAEQLACVIAHESMHVLKSPTLEEETRATKKEADCWNNLRFYSKTYPDTKLTARLNKLAKNDYAEIQKQIANTQLYREQFMSGKEF